MSDNIEYFVGAQNTQHQVCRVAYTLNNDQPVICTFIGDQPLFYMDHEEEYDLDDGLFDAEELGLLEEELMHLQKELEAFDRLSDDVPSYSVVNEVALKEFSDNTAVICDAADQAASDIHEIVEVLSQSRLAKAYLDNAQEYDVKLALSAQVQDGEYNRRNGKILINSHLSLSDQILVAVRELRRHWQHRQGALIHPLMFHPDNAVLVNRVQQADLAVSTVRVAWELQLADYKDAWTRLENSSLADLAYAFAREAYVDFRTINNGQASASVFEAWFLSGLCFWSR